MKTVQCLEICPKVICGMPVDFARGFDVKKKDGTLVKHFEKFEDAELLRQSDSRKYSLIYWTILPEEVKAE